MIYIQQLRLPDFLLPTTLQTRKKILDLLKYMQIQEKMEQPKIYTLKNSVYHIVRHNIVDIFQIPESTPLSWLFR